MNLENFSYLFLVTLASKDNLSNNELKYAKIPVDFKSRIVRVLNNESWYEEFNNIIDIDLYKENHFIWEENFVKCMLSLLNRLGKHYDYYMDLDIISIGFTKDSIESVLKRYSEDEKKAMRDFTELLTSYSMSREYLENSNDYGFKTTIKRSI